MADKKIEVKGYERKKPTKQKSRETKPVVGVEIPHVAPKEGEGITQISPQKAPGAPPRRPSGGGVTIMGGGTAGRRGGVNVSTKRG